MGISEWILGGGLIAIIGLILKNNSDIDDKLRRNYKRLDEVKEYQEQTYTRKDICCERHEQITKQLDKINEKLDKLINERK